MLKKLSLGSAIALLLAYGLWSYMSSTTHQLYGEIIHRVDTTEKVIALTFDDDPSPFKTEILLDILDKKSIKATFFLVGHVIEEFTEIAQDVVDRGHDIGNHSTHHFRTVFVDYATAMSEVEDTNALIRGLGFSGEIRFRAPYAKKLYNLPKYLGDHGITSITWDIRSRYSSKDSAREIHDMVVNSAKPGSIIILHGHSSTEQEAIPNIIDTLQAQGYKFVTIHELLQYRK